MAKDLEENEYRQGESAYDTIKSTSSDRVPIPQLSVSGVSSPLLSPNWFNALPSTDHVGFFKATNWATSKLGPLESWGFALRLHTFTVFTDSRAAAIYWGPKKVAIYNEAFVPLACKAHPALMGTPICEGTSEIWDSMKQIFEKAEQTEVAAEVKETQVFIERGGFLEETYFAGSLNPLRGDTGKIDGFCHSVYEITQARINERRREMMEMMQVPLDSDTRSLASHVMPVLEQNPGDIPMALLFEADEDTQPGSCLMRLRGQIGLPADHPLAAEQWDLSSAEGIMPLLRQARWNMRTEPVGEVFKDVQWRGFGEPSQFVSYLPLSSPERLFGFLVIGANPRRRIDEDHYQFMRDLSSKVTSICVSISTAEETRDRNQRLQKQLEDHQRRVQFMAQNAIIGMSYLSLDGCTVWANEQYYNITQHPHADRTRYKMSFMDIYLEEDQPKALEVWNRLLDGESPISVELRLKRTFTPPIGNPEPARALVYSSRGIEESLFQAIMTFTTDVSAFRWAEASEARKAAEAQRAKAQQEEFIDFVSHELRNPLSAIFQLADTIIQSFPYSHDKEITNADLTAALQGNIENAETLLMCAKNQKRIVDDVLTLSKLEYTMLSVTPRPTDASNLVTRWMKMFEGQLISSNIDFDVVTLPSIKGHEIDMVFLDEVRVQQIFINLLTNAIKFTKAEKSREIVVSYGASLKSPKEGWLKHLNWAPSQKEVVDLTLLPEWGRGRQLYLTFMISDTGIGMTEDEIKKLFGRFEQASPKTSIKYGGSGLGLFLCQKLAERQGGEVGVSSTPGDGSTFAFYVKCRRVEDTGDIVTPLASPLYQLPSPFADQAPYPYFAPGVDMGHLHVLLVEDNTVNQAIVQRQLTKAGCVVYVANDGVEALQMLKESDVWADNVQGEEAEKQKENKPKHLDIILMDWEMPVMDGLECSREIRKWEQEGSVVRHVEIMLTTANVRDEQLVIALESGIDSVMSKPYMVADLLEKMKLRLSIAENERLAPDSPIKNKTVSREGGG